MAGRSVAHDVVRALLITLAAWVGVVLLCLCIGLALDFAIGHASRSSAKASAPTWQAERCWQCGGTGVTSVYVPTEAPCKWCGGTGQMVCPDCGGSGVVIDADTLYRRECLRCWGRGMKPCIHCVDGKVTIGGYWSQEPCSKCGGTGRVWVQKY